MRFHLSPHSPVPLYHQLAEAIRQAIRTGDLSEGHRLPPEVEIGNQTGVSRPTVRQAIGELTREGLVARRRGVGTFVRADRPGHLLHDLGSFTEAMKRQGLVPGARVLVRRVLPAPAAVAGMLNIPARSPVAVVRRLRTAGGRPILINTAYFPVELAPDLLKQGLSGSVYALLETRYGIKLRWARETYEPAPVRGRDAQLLRVHSGSPGLLVERVTYADGDRPVEFSQSLIRGDRCKLYTRLERRPMRSSADAGSIPSSRAVVMSER